MAPVALVVAFRTPCSAAISELPIAPAARPELRNPLISENRLVPLPPEIVKTSSYTLTHSSH